MSDAFFVQIPARGSVTLSGPDCKDFLQGLITNDIGKLDHQNLLYACLLTPQGKFLHDFFIREENDMFILDCEGGERAQDLAKRLSLYKLRSKLEISTHTEMPVYAVFESDEQDMKDPRHQDFGRRLYKKPDLPEKPFEIWDQKRIALCIPDGSRDMEIERSTMLECGLDHLNAIDWDKGCYVGQELTARMHYRGLAKKHLYTIHFKDAPPSPFSDIVENGKVIGNMRSSSGQAGIALLKDETAKNLKNGDNQVSLSGS